MIWEALQGVIPVLVLLIGGGIWAVRADGRSRANATWLRRLQDEVDGEQKRLSEFKERIAKDYVSIAMIQEIEARIMKQFDRLYDAVRDNGKKETHHV